MGRSALVRPYRNDPKLGRSAPRGSRMQQGDWLRLVRAVVVALAFVGVVAAGGDIPNGVRGATTVVVLAPASVKP